MILASVQQSSDLQPITGSGWLVAAAVFAVALISACLAVRRANRIINQAPRPRVHQSNVTAHGTGKPCRECEHVR